MSLLHNHPERRAGTQIHSLVLPPMVKTPIVGVLGRGPACCRGFPIFFWMATSVSPIPRSTLIWFGSLEFMSTGFGYDMILLSVRGSGGARVIPTRSKAPCRPHHHASPPKRRRDQHRHRPTAVARSPPRAEPTNLTVEGPIALRTRTTVTMANQRSDHQIVPRDGIPRALSPPSALLPHDLFTSRRTLLFGMDNAATSQARTICPGANTYVERPLALPRSTEARQEAHPVAECPGFPQIRRPRRLGPGRYTLTTLRQQLVEEWRRCFYTTELDPDSESDSYDPTRECFNIDGAVATTDDLEDDNNAAAPTAPAPAAGANLRTPRNKGRGDTPPQDGRAAQLMQLCKLKAKLDEDRENLDQLEWTLKQDQSHLHYGGARGHTRDVYRQIVEDRELEQLISRFPRASQNIMAATMLLCNMTEPSKSQARHIRDEVQGLLHVAAAQQAESSASRRRGAATEKFPEPARNEIEVPVHHEPPPRGKKTVPIQERLFDN